MLGPGTATTAGRMREAQVQDQKWRRAGQAMTSWLGSVKDKWEGLLEVLGLPCR